MGARAFEEINGEVVQTCAFIVVKNIFINTKTKFINLQQGKNSDEKRNSLLKNENVHTLLSKNEFLSIPSTPLCYWAEKPLIDAFNNTKKIGSLTINKSLNLTGDNNRFLRYFWEINSSNIGKGKKWLFYAKGGAYKKWYGNFDYTIQWDNEAINFYRNDKTARIIPEELWWKEGITWTKVTTGTPGFRLLPIEATYDVGGSSIIVDNHDTMLSLMGFLNSKISEKLIRMLNTSVNIQVGDIESLPALIDNISPNLVNEAINISRDNWNLKEISFDFKGYEIKESQSIELFAHDFFSHIKQKANELLLIENKINHKICNNLNLNISDHKVQGEDLTLEYFTGNEQVTDSFTNELILDLISYIIGITFGRYSLNYKGLCFPNPLGYSFSHLIDNGYYKSFEPDADGIIPITDQEWFKDDATNRFREFVKVVWGEEHLQENLDFVAESLCLNAIKPKKSEPAMETIRRYLSTQFYKDHLKTYKKRPIYWLFSSGKQKAFECLVYLHRYNEGTLSRMRTEYVTPLLGKYDAYIDQLKQQVENADSTAEANRLKKEQDALIKKHVELREFDDKLKHYADMRISLDLDDGVKVNYGKFGDLLSDVKAITGSDSGAE